MNPVIWLFQANARGPSNAARLNLLRLRIELYTRMAPKYITILTPKPFTILEWILMMVSGVICITV